jgi:hypothetical protein
VTLNVTAGMHSHMGKQVLCTSRRGTQQLTQRWQSKQQASNGDQVLYPAVSWDRWSIGLNPWRLRHLQKLSETSLPPQPGRDMTYTTPGQLDEQGQKFHSLKAYSHAWLQPFRTGFHRCLELDRTNHNRRKLLSNFYSSHAKEISNMSLMIP